MSMHACATAGNTFALSRLTLSDVRDVDAAIESLRDAASRNLRASPGSAHPFEVPGATPSAQAGRLVLNGQRPDGSAVTEHLLTFVWGASLYQATVVGGAPDEAVVSTFFSGIKVAP